MEAIQDQLSTKTALLQDMDKFIYQNKFVYFFMKSQMVDCFLLNELCHANFEEELSTLAFLLEKPQLNECPVSYCFAESGHDLYHLKTKTP